MSATAGQGLEFEANDPVAVDAICTACRVKTAKETRTDNDGEVPTSFRHVCHECQRVTWWNVLDVRDVGGDER